MDSLVFLESTDRVRLQPVYVLFGDEDFLKRQVLLTLRAAVFGGASSDLGFATYPGDTAIFVEVHDELATLPFLAPRRLVVVENADPFVTRHRASLEKYVVQPAAMGILVLEVKSWPSNTRLARLVPSDATLACKAPPAYKLPPWCMRWSASRHDKELSSSAARLLVDLIGPNMGQLDQELEKLAIYAGATRCIESDDVDQLVGSSRTENVFKIFDTVAAGRPGEALAILDRLLDHGEDAIRVLGAFSFQLRRLAQVARLSQQGLSLQAAMDQAGLPPYARPGVERQLQHLGASRIDRLYDWLLEVDLGLKGSSQLPARVQLERLLVRLAGRKAGKDYDMTDDRMTG